VLTENCMEFRERFMINDEKLRDSRAIVRNGDEEDNSEESEVITINPNKLYESSDEDEAPKIVLNHTEVKKPKKAIARINCDYFHCRFCDVVFPESLACATHEELHDPSVPYHCNMCSFKFDTHALLIGHIRSDHGLVKPFICSQCKRCFSRRCELRKHTFVHAGIRLYKCDMCAASFTRNTNLTKHKRTHTDPVKSFKCSLCPRTFSDSSNLNRHLEIHLKKTYNCKVCNLAFARREKMEIHEKTHIVHEPAPSEAMMHQPVMFYNQPPQDPITAPMNFYTENAANHNRMAFSNDSATLNFYDLQNQQHFQEAKNFHCTICSSSFARKKELNRHLNTLHAAIRSYNCSKCPKSFNRSDKLARHERSHDIPSFFNCALCPAVFIRRSMLDIHSKIHSSANNGDSLMAPIDFGQQQQQMATLEPIANFQPSFSHSTPSMQIAEQQQQQQQQYLQHPMNLTINNSPMNLSLHNSKMDQRFPQEMEQSMRKHSEDEEDGGLRIVVEDEPPPQQLKYFDSPVTFHQSPQSLLKPFEPPLPPLNDPFPEMKKELPDSSILFPILSNMINQNNMTEPFEKELPMEILQNK